MQQGCPKSWMLHFIPYKKKIIFFLQSFLFCLELRLPTCKTFFEWFRTLKNNPSFLFFLCFFYQQPPHIWFFFYCCWVHYSRITKKGWALLSMCSQMFINKQFQIQQCMLLCHRFRCSITIYGFTTLFHCTRTFLKCFHCSLFHAPKLNPFGLLLKRVSLNKANAKVHGRGNRKKNTIKTVSNKHHDTTNHNGSPVWNHKTGFPSNNLLHVRILDKHTNGAFRANGSDGILKCNLFTGWFEILFPFVCESMEWCYAEYCKWQAFQPIQTPFFFQTKKQMLIKIHVMCAFVPIFGTTTWT